MAMPKREIKVGKDKYEFYLIGGMDAFNASRKITAKTAMLLPNLINKNTTGFNTDFYNLIMDNFDELLDTFIDKNNLRCNGAVIADFDEHFAGKFTEIPQLLYKVILENDRDFFHSLPILMTKVMAKLNEKLQANSLQMPNGITEAMDKVASNLKENLG